jgi:hypothetical protein
MEAKKRLGIWMDHSRAHIIEYNGHPEEKEIVYSSFTPKRKSEVLHRSEFIMHHKEQGEQGSFYEKIGEVIKDYDQVVLFGPTDAKLELMNMIKQDSHFDHVKIEALPADKITTSEKYALLNEYFAKA